MADKVLKLLVCYHKKDILFKDNIMTPIHLGRSLALKKADYTNNPQIQWLLDNMIGDDTGENISDKNGSYNELTSLYWAWKNYEALGNPDYIGLMHYRRHFYYKPSNQNVVEYDGVDCDYLKEIGYDEEILLKLLNEYDFIAHISKVDCIKKHYADNHKLEDLNKAIEILIHKYPAYKHIATRYINQGEGCFCNMFIFPKKMFFDYCQWLFSILTEFENQVDISEKRLFISERLTGIYIAKAIEKGKKVKKLPIVFIKDPIKIPIALPLNKSNTFTTAVSMLSFLENAEQNTSFVFYLLANGPIASDIVERFQSFSRLYKKCEIQIIDVPSILVDNNIDISVFEFPDHYPLVLQNVLPKVNKIIYCNDKILALKDFEEVYRTCSVDDFWINGIPISNPDALLQDKKIANNVYVMNLARLRKHNVIIDKYKNIVLSKTANSVINIALDGQIGYLPEWFYTSLRLNKDTTLFHDSIRRAEKQERTLWKHLIEYADGWEPWINVQGTYSIFWWDIAKLVPSTIPFFYFDAQLATNLVIEQQTEINKQAENTIKNYSITSSKNVKSKKVSLVKKALVYYSNHGLKATIKKIIQKTFKGKR